MHRYGLCLFYWLRYKPMAGKVISKKKKKLKMKIYLQHVIFLHCEASVFSWTVGVNQYAERSLNLCDSAFRKRNRES